MIARHRHLVSVSHEVTCHHKTTQSKQKLNPRQLSNYAAKSIIYLKHIKELIKTKLEYNMHLLHHRQGDDKVQDGKGKQGQDSHKKCPHCGRKLMERKGVLRRLKPVSNAFVVHGHCLTCHSESGEEDNVVDGKEEEGGEEKDDREVSDDITDP